MKAVGFDGFASYEEVDHLCTCGGEILTPGKEMCAICAHVEQGKRREKEYQRRKLARHRVHKRWIAMHPKSDNKDCGT